MFCIIDCSFLNRLNKLVISQNNVCKKKGMSIIIENLLFKK